MGGEETRLRRFVLAFVMSDDRTCRSYNSGDAVKMFPYFPEHRVFVCLTEHCFFSNLLLIYFLVNHLTVFI